MTTCKHTWQVVFIATCLFAMIGTPAAFGAVLLYDGLDGYSEGSLIGQPYLGDGFSTTATTWARNNTASGWFVDVVSGGFTYSKDGKDLLVTGNQHVEQALINGGVRARLDVPLPCPIGILQIDIYQRLRLGRTTL